MTGPIVRGVTFAENLQRLAEKIVRDTADWFGTPTGTVTMSEWIAEQKGLR